MFLSKIRNKTTRMVLFEAQFCSWKTVVDISTQFISDVIHGERILLLSSKVFGSDPFSIGSTEAYSLPHRLHAAGYVHKSLRTHKILVQPGPLTHPPHMRTMSKPRFRIVDFGCARSIEDETDGSWDALVKCEVYQAKVAVYGSHIKPLRKNCVRGTL